MIATIESRMETLAGTGSRRRRRLGSRAAGAVTTSGTVTDGMARADRGPTEPGSVGRSTRHTLRLVTNRAGRPAARAGLGGDVHVGGNRAAGSSGVNCSSEPQSRSPVVVAGTSGNALRSAAVRVQPSGPPPSASCQALVDSAPMRSGRMRYSGTSATPSGGRTVVGTGTPDRRPSRAAPGSVDPTTSCSVRMVRHPRRCHGEPLVGCEVGVRGDETDACRRRRAV